MIVMPPGVMPRYLYSVAAIVLAWFLVAARPIGDHQSDARAYQFQGIYGGLLRYEEETEDIAPLKYKDQPYRWRSLKRWLRAARTWWPDWTGSDLSTLLAMFLQRSRGRGRQAAVDAAIAAHAQLCRGFAM